MGGERQDVVTSPAPTKKKVGRVGDVQSIRFHENAGQVHFHVEAEGLKCAVPVATWAKAWERLRSPATTDVESFTYSDVDNKSVVWVQTMNSPDSDGEGWTLEAKIHVHALTTVNETFTQLDKFTNPA